MLSSVGNQFRHALKRAAGPGFPFVSVALPVLSVQAMDVLIRASRRRI
jgi:hypothetical protein